MRRLVSLFAAGLLAAACADPAATDQYDEAEAPPDDDGKADADTELYVRAGDTSLWVTREVARRQAPGGDLFVLRGRASRTITEGMGFIIDDPYGDFAIRSARTFEVTWPVDTARTLADGVNQFVRLHFAASGNRPDSITSRVVVRPRLGSFTGSSKLYLTAEMTPVVTGGTVMYRAKGTSTVDLAALTVVTAGQALTDVRLTGPRAFQIDLAPDTAFAIAGGREGLEIAAVPTSGSPLAKQARLGLAVKKLGMTTDDPYEKWPRNECETPTKACLQSLPDGTLDLGPCGEALEVLACTRQVGVFVDDVSFQAAFAQGVQRTGAAAFRADAAGLVGAARVEQFVGGAEQTIESRLEGFFGRWYLTATARTSALGTAVDGALRSALVHPLDLVDPTEPATDAATVRATAADALLTELARHDFVTTEFARSYEQLVTEYPAQHVAAIRELRETANVEPYPGMPGVDVVTGRWLGAHIEVSIDHATGAARGVYIEID